MNPHIELLQETTKILGSKNWVEISHETPFGFHEIAEPTRKNISVTDFLNNPTSVDTDFYDTCVLHILLGCGVGIDIVKEVIKKSLDVFSTVIVLEHDRTSSDWNTDAIRKDHYIDNCFSAGDFLLLALNNDWNCSRVLHMSNKRNMIVEISK